MRLKDKKSLALVLSGGGIKAAAFHVGVCVALKEHGFQFAGGSAEDVKALPNEMCFKTYVGSSAGAVIAGTLAAGHCVEALAYAYTKGQSEMPQKWYKNKAATKGAEKSSSQKLKGPKLFHKMQKPQRAFDLPALSYSDIFSLNLPSGSPSRWLQKAFKKRPVITGGLEVFLKKGLKIDGLFSTKNIAKYFRNQVYADDSFQSLGVRLYIVATDLNRSQKVVFGAFKNKADLPDTRYASFAKISEAIAASASLPPLFTPYKLTNEQGQNMYFFDGEIRDTLSTHVAADEGADLVVASYSMQPYSYNQKMGSLHEYGMPMVIEQAIYQCVQQKIDSARAHRRSIKQLFSAVQGYLKQADIKKEQADKLMEILNSKLTSRCDVEYIYIHPSAEDYNTFFADHFSLRPKIVSQIVTSGYRAARLALRKYA